MTCRELVERVTDHLEHRLAPPEARAFDAHLAGCDGCTEYVKQIRATIRTIGAIRLDAPDSTALRRIFTSRTQS